MTREALKRAREEAAKFVGRADALLAFTSDDYPIIQEDPKRRGAVRRQSMELTRALADLRRPN